jgi:hypothetical protein
MHLINTSTAKDNITFFILSEIYFSKQNYKKAFEKTGTIRLKIASCKHPIFDKCVFSFKDF